MVDDRHGMPAAPPGADGVRVLLIDESRVSCLFFAGALAEQPGWTVKWATDLDAGLQLAASFRPTTVVRAVDPDGAGAAAVGELRAALADRDLPILAFSAVDQPELRARSLDAGALDFVIKTGDPSELVRQVRRGAEQYGRAVSARLLDAPGGGPETRASGPRVLMIDDSRAQCLAYADALQGLDDVLFEFTNDPRAALGEVARVRPSVILLDLEMPEVTGFELLPALKSSPETRPIPVIVLSGLADPAIKARAFALGASDYAEKQMHAVELVSRIRCQSAAYYNARQLDQSIQELTITKRSLELQRNFVRNTFGRYLSDDVVNTLLETPDGLQLGGEKREITVMMTDLRGFTAITERLAPEQVLAVLNNYLELMTDVLLRWSATIDEIVGDGIVAVFGAPLQRPDHAARAVACAVEMQLAMAEVNAWNRDRGYPALTMGIGINTGEVVVGNIGSRRRAKYGVLGRNVNLAARIEACTVGGQVMVSESTRAACDDLLDVIGQMELRAKGVERPLQVFEVGGVGGDYGLVLPPRDELVLRPLQRPIPVKLAVLERKQSGRELHDGVIVRVHPHAAEIRSTIDATVLVDLRITVLDEHGGTLTTELYGKVVALGAPGRQCFVVRFTSVPPEATSLLADAS